MLLFSENHERAFIGRPIAHHGGGKSMHIVDIEEISMPMKQKAPAQAMSQSPDLEPKIRREFPETWIWIDLYIGYTKAFKKIVLQCFSIVCHGEQTYRVVQKF